MRRQPRPLPQHDILDFATALPDFLGTNGTKVTVGRVTVELILRKLSEGATEADLLDAYPRLNRQDIQAALAYAASSLAHETILILTSK